MSLIPRAEAVRRNAAKRKPNAPEANRASILADAIDEFASKTSFLHPNLGRPPTVTSRLAKQVRATACMASTDRP